MVRKVPGFLDGYLPIVLSFICDLEDDEEWYKPTETNEDEEEPENCDIAEEIIDRMALYLGGSYMAPALFSFIPNMMNDSDWRK